MRTFIIILLLPAALGFAIPVFSQTYQVRKVPQGSVRVDGKGTSKVWGKANVLTDFVYPWDSAVAPATSFSALWDGEWFYGLYKVKDDSVITLAKNNDKMEVVHPTGWRSL